MTTMYVYDFPEPVGRLGIAANEKGISHVFPLGQADISGFLVCETELIATAANQLSEYFSGSRKIFDLPLAPQGTPFQQRVWSSLLQIPYGKTITYKELALHAGSPRGSRAVGQANHCNPLPFFIPCHRVISSTGTLGGYALGVPLKEWLLFMEGSVPSNK